MRNQDFRYLGGGCKSEDFGSEVQYSCRTYDGGPGDGTRRVDIFQGDWYGIIEDNDSVTQVRNKITIFTKILRMLMEMLCMIINLQVQKQN